MTDPASMALADVLERVGVRAAYAALRARWPDEPDEPTQVEILAALAAERDAATDGGATMEVPR